MEMITRSNRGQRTFRGRKMFHLSSKTSPEITIPATTRNY